MNQKMMGKEKNKEGAKDQGGKVIAGGIAIQGYEGSFHQVAARSFFGKEVEVIPCANFRDLIQIAGDAKQSAGGIMAIENSIAGSILPNYNLLQKSRLKVVGEVYLSISQNLLVNPGVKLEDIKVVETEDTALSAKLLHQHRSKHTAAIASKLAAELFKLDIIGPDIHTMKNNVTRFLVLKRTADATDDVKANKASVYFQTNHARGALSQVLTKIAQGGINLSKLQSMPIPGSHFKYGFYADMEFETRKEFEKVMTSIASLTNSVKIFGVYQRGKIVKG
jgi:prephenate dehydratase